MPVDSDSDVRNGWYHTVSSIFFRRTYIMDVLWTVHVLMCKFWGKTLLFSANLAVARAMGPTARSGEACIHSCVADGP